MKKIDKENFIFVYENAFPKEYCEKVIEHYIANDLNASQLCHLAEELIKIASYVSDDPERLLAAYNVDYNRPNYTKVK